MKDFRSVGSPADNTRVRRLEQATEAAGSDHSARSAAATRALVGRILQASGLIFVAIGVYLMIAGPSSLPDFVQGVAAPLLVAMGFVEYGIGRVFRRVT